METATKNERFERSLVSANKILGALVPLALFVTGVLTFVLLLLVPESVWADNPVGILGLANISMILIIGSIIVGDVRKIRNRLDALLPDDEHNTR